MRGLPALWSIAVLLQLPLGCFAGNTAVEPARLSADYLVRAWETDEGFPHIAGTSFAQTADGYLWIGTFRSLVRFDGLRFTVVTSLEAPMLENAMVLKLAVDREGALWVGTSRGVGRHRAGQWTGFG
ncbi:MAG TPA: two-component regulator propeller domain-containing protein, partial [Opitutaceae bacterium]